jgi:hypothetical protein
MIFEVHSNVPECAKWGDQSGTRCTDVVHLEERENIRTLKGSPHARFTVNLLFYYEVSMSEGESARGY